MSSTRVAIIKRLEKDQKDIIKLIRLLENKNKKTLATLAFIDQGDDGYSYRVAGFLALNNNKSESRLIYKLSPGWSWGYANIKNTWMQKITPSELAMQLKTVDVIWVFKRDAWINKALVPLTKDCDKDTEWTYLVKTNNLLNTFRCISRSIN